MEELMKPKQCQKLISTMRQRAVFICICLRQTESWLLLPEIVSFFERSSKTLSRKKKWENFYSPPLFVCLALKNTIRMGLFTLMASFISFMFKLRSFLFTSSCRSFSNAAKPRTTRRVENFPLLHRSNSIFSCIIIPPSTCFELKFFRSDCRKICDK